MGLPGFARIENSGPGSLEGFLGPRTPKTNNKNQKIPDFFGKGGPNHLPLS